jgi:TPR repeat protein
LILGSDVNSISSSDTKPADSSNPGTYSMSLNAGFDIPDKDIPALREAALRGSGASALKLAQFYGPLKRDSARRLYWLTIAAENGNPVGMHNLAYLLLHGEHLPEENRDHEIRARFWLERAVRAGSNRSREMLSEMGNKGL